jgi:ubiquinone/menaquinone biosynthesis C-methylase UbiE
MDCEKSISLTHTGNQTKHFDSHADLYEQFIQYKNYDIDFCLLKRFITGTDARIGADLGCGTGKYAVGILQHHKHLRIYGVDISLQMMRNAWERSLKEEVNDRLYLVGGNLTQLPFNDSSLDFIVQGYSMHHIAEAQRLNVLMEIRRILKPNGFFMLSEIGRRHYSEAITMWDRWQIIMSARVNPTKLRNQLSKAGFWVQSYTQRQESSLMRIKDIASYLHVQGIIQEEESSIFHQLSVKYGLEMRITTHRIHLVSVPAPMTPGL